MHKNPYIHRFFPVQPDVSLSLYSINFIFYAPGLNDRGHIVFVLSVCLSVCLSVVNLNLRYNIRTVRDRDFIFDMHTPLMMLLKMTLRSMTL